MECALNTGIKSRRNALQCEYCCIQTIHTLHMKRILFRLIHMLDQPLVTHDVDENSDRRKEKSREMAGSIMVSSIGQWETSLMLHL